MLETLVWLVVTCLIVAAVCGLLIYLVRSAPFIGAPFKPWAEWVIIAIGVLIIILKILPLAR